MVYILLLLLVEVFLFVTNFKSGAYLMGWDNIMPEFNIWLNLKRSFFGIWQEYRGLGLLDGLSHAANLLHTLYIGFLDLFLPQSAVRYVFIHTTHFLGGVAFFYLINYLIKNKKASLVASLFYMLNLGIIQLFFAPLEVFAFHYVALPLLTYFTLKSLDNPSKKNLLFLSLMFLLMTPQGFVPTIFLVFMLVLVLLLFSHFRNSGNWKLPLFIFFIFIAINSFWLLPYSYSAIYNSRVIPQTRINRFSSEEIYFRNKAFGNIGDVLKLRGFMMDAVELDHEKKENDYFMKSWREYEAGTLYNVFYLGLFAVSLLGLYKIIKDRRKEFYPFVFSALVAFFFLASDVPILRNVNDFLRNNFSVFAEVFRIPFTKFITLFVFCMSIFLSLGVSILLKKLKWNTFFVVFLILASLGIALPAFQGYFTSPLLRVKLPSEYSQMMNYLYEKDENQRIALLPSYTFWNWQYRSFGQRGSGFLWYGVKQPLLDRPFDPWSLENEKFYDEFSRAINSESQPTFENLLYKYDISYLLLDEYLVNNVTAKPINYRRLKNFLSKIDNLKEDARFGKLTLYKNKTSRGFVYEVDEKALVKQIALTDFSFSQENKSIVASVTLPSKINSFGIPNLFQQEGLIAVKPEVKNGQLVITPIYPLIEVDKTPYQINAQPVYINLSRVFNPQKITLTDVSHTFLPGEEIYIRNNFLNSFKLERGATEEIVTFDTRQYQTLGQEFKIERASPFNQIKFSIPKIESPYTSSNLIKKGQYEVKAPFKDLSFFRRTDSFVKADDRKSSESVTLEVRGDSAEVVSWREDMPHDASYVVFVDYQHISGLPITFYLDNPFEKRAEFEERLSKNSQTASYILPYTQRYFRGYGIHFIVKSLGNEVAKSRIKEISIYPIPLKTLENINFGSSSNLGIKTALNYSKINFAKYKVELSGIKNKIGDKVIVLSQAYHPGWKAYIENQELENQVKVHDWANGWKLDNQQSNNNQIVTIYFWPQYLEFMGFGLLVTALLAIIFLYGKFKL